MVTACRLVWRACYVPPMVCDALGRYPFAVLSFIGVLVMLFVRRLILMLEMFAVAVTVLPLTIPYFSFRGRFRLSALSVCLSLFGCCPLHSIPMRMEFYPPVFKSFLLFFKYNSLL